MSTKFKVKWRTEVEGTFEINREDVEGLTEEEIRDLVSEGADTDMQCNTVLGQTIQNMDDVLKWAKGS